MRPREGGLRGGNFWLRLLQPARSVCVSLSVLFSLGFLIFKSWTIWKLNARKNFTFYSSYGCLGRCRWCVSVQVWAVVAVRCCWRCGRDVFQSSESLVDAADSLISSGHLSPGHGRLWTSARSLTAVHSHRQYQVPSATKLFIITQLRRLYAALVSVSVRSKKIGVKVGWCAVPRPAISAIWRAQASKSVFFL